MSRLLTQKPKWPTGATGAKAVWGHALWYSFYFLATVEKYFITNHRQEALGPMKMTEIFQSCWTDRSTSSALEPLCEHVPCPQSKQNETKDWDMLFKNRNKQLPVQTGSNLIPTSLRVLSPDSRPVWLDWNVFWALSVPPPKTPTGKKWANTWV